MGIHVLFNEYDGLELQIFQRAFIVKATHCV